MSQHHYACTWKGQPITIMMGWDRPLQGYFMVIEHDDFNGDDEGFIYSNLNDPELKPSRGMSQSVGYLLERLIGLGLKVPQRMLDAIEADAKVNAGNREVWYDHKGNVVASVSDEDVAS